MIIMMIIIILIIICSAVIPSGSTVFYGYFFWLTVIDILADIHLGFHCTAQLPLVVLIITLYVNFSL